MKTRNLISFDWAMKRLLRNKANFDVIEGFLSELLHRRIIIKNISESEANNDNENEKGNTVDILVEADDSELFIIELQFDNLLFYFHRLLYGVAKAIANHLEKGKPYDKIRKIYSISIVHYGIGEVDGEGKGPNKKPDDYIYHGYFNLTGLHSKNELKLSPGQRRKYNKTFVGELMPEYYIIKLNNFNDVAKNTLDEWIYFLKHNKVEDGFTAQGLDKVKDILNYDNLTSDQKQAYDNSIDKRLVAENALVTANLEGKIEGIAESNKKAIVNALNAGYSIDIMQTITGLSIEEIEKIIETI